jgi:hypothetical protein
MAGSSFGCTRKYHCLERLVQLKKDLEDSCRLERGLLSGLKVHTNVEIEIDAADKGTGAGYCIDSGMEMMVVLLLAVS